MNQTNMMLVDPATMMVEYAKVVPGLVQAALAHAVMRYEPATVESALRAVEPMRSSASEEAFEQMQVVAVKAAVAPRVDALTRDFAFSVICNDIIAVAMKALAIAAVEEDRPASDKVNDWLTETANVARARQ